MNQFWMYSQRYFRYVSMLPHEKRLERMITLIERGAKIWMVQYRSERISFEKELSDFGINQRDSKMLLDYLRYADLERIHEKFNIDPIKARNTLTTIRRMLLIHPNKKFVELVKRVILF